MKRHDDCQTVVITGAGSGVGRATALALAQRGYALVLNGRHEASLRETEALLGTPAEVVIGDIGDHATAASIVEAALSRFGQLDAVVNNAGIAVMAPIATTTAQLFQETFATNVFGPASLISRAWSALCLQTRSVIVNVSSMAAIDPFDGFFAYAASKSALESFTRSVASEGRAAGVEAYSLRLGTVETGLLRRLFDRDVLPEGVPLRPESVAEVVVECIVGGSRYASGEVITLVAEPSDGGP